MRSVNATRGSDRERKLPCLRGQFLLRAGLAFPPSFITSLRLGTARTEMVYHSKTIIVDSRIKVDHGL